MRTARVTLGLIVAVAMGLLLLHIFIRPIPPDQQAPEGHFGDPCALCHLVIASADPVEVP
jgi:hypothetical protein